MKRTELLRYKMSLDRDGETWVQSIACGDEVTTIRFSDLEARWFVDRFAESGIRAKTGGKPRTRKKAA